MVDLDRIARESESECPECGAPVIVTATAKELPRTQLGRCPNGHEVERHLDLQSSWELRSK
jgi:ribosomal protein S27AE